jgi:hypothetical protein
MAMVHSPLLVAGFNKAAKSPNKEKVKKGETANHDTQVGELAGAYKEPTPTMRIKKAAQEEKHHATRRWIAGEISNKVHDTIHARADKVIKNPRNYFGKNKGKQSQ